MVKSREDNQGTEAPAQQDFESALAQLEALVARMESGALPLEQALQSYEQGVELAQLCQRKLDLAQEQVSVLQGNLLRPLSGDEAEGES
ncbi:MAG: exodeoxyribonuclease VII small subunit [Alcaligenes sp.]